MHARTHDAHCFGCVEFTCTLSNSGRPSDMRTAIALRSVSACATPAASASTSGRFEVRQGTTGERFLGFRFLGF